MSQVLPPSVQNGVQTLSLLRQVAQLPGGSASLRKIASWKTWTFTYHNLNPVPIITTPISKAAAAISNHQLFFVSLFVCQAM
jgi:hypothetical protein